MSLLLLNADGKSSFRYLIPIIQVFPNEFRIYEIFL